MEDRRVFIKATNTLAHKNTNTRVAKFEYSKAIYQLSVWRFCYDRMDDNYTIS